MVKKWLSSSCTLARLHKLHKLHLCWLLTYLSLRRSHSGISWSELGGLDWLDWSCGNVSFPPASFHVGLPICIRGIDSSISARASSEFDSMDASGLYCGDHWKIISDDCRCFAGSGSRGYPPNREHVISTSSKTLQRRTTSLSCRNSLSRSAEPFLIHLQARVEMRGASSVLYAASFPPNSSPIPAHDDLTISSHSCPPPGPPRR